MRPPWNAVCRSLDKISIEWFDSDEADFGELILWVVRRRDNVRETLLQRS